MALRKPLAIPSVNNVCCMWKKEERKEKKNSDNKPNTPAEQSTEDKQFISV